MKWKQLACLLAGVLVLLAALGCAGQEATEDPASDSESAPASDEGEEYAVDVSAEEETISVPEGQQQVDVSFTVTNTGENPDTYTLVTKAFGVEWRGEGIPTEAVLEPGESETLTIPFTLDVQGSISGLDVSLQATSQSDPGVSDEAVCNLGF